MKIIALDLGDVHTGVAMSDPDRIIAKPYKTISTEILNDFIEEIIKKEAINTIILGYPKTMMGKISAQTQKIIDTKTQLEKKFPEITWVLWDERLTSKNADKFKKGKDKEDKIRLHSIAAALILESYLEFLRIRRLNEQ
jgi:putative holliday junction resolvase